MIKVVNNTVQQQAVNLAYAEPCPKPGHGFFFCGPCPRENETAQSPSACGKVCPSAHRPPMNAIDLSGHSPRPLSDKPTEAEASGCATVRANGTGSRATPWFEGAHPLRRCAPLSESAHLGKPRRFLRRCAPFSKVRTKKCAPSPRTNSRPGQSPGLAGETIEAASRRQRDLRANGTGSRALPWDW
jgi:hypothetical protein